MKKLIALTAVTMLSVTAAAFADASSCSSKPRTITGNPARAMIQALRFAGVAPTRTGTDSAYTEKTSLAKLSCDEFHGADDGIYSYACQAPTLAWMNPESKSHMAENAQAKVLFDAAYGLGIMADGALGQTIAELDNLECVLTYTDNSGPTYQCTGAAYWASDCR